MYLRNAWYGAAASDEIGAAHLGRTLYGQRMVVFRGAGGAVSVLEDFCPHRGAPLSLGRVRDDGAIVCGYHGLLMGGDSRCVGMPGQRVRPTIRVYPAIERYGFVWVWPGEKSLADPVHLHHLPWAESPEWTYAGAMYHVACDYRLMIEVGVAHAGHGGHEAPADRKASSIVRMSASWRPNNGISPSSQTAI